MALKHSWNAIHSGKNGTRAAAAAEPADDDLEDLRELGDEAPAPADAVADDPEATITAADAREIFTGLVNVAARLEALEKRMNAGSRGAKPAATTSVPAAPRKAAVVDPLRPSASTVTEWARAAFGAGRAAGRWEEPSDVAAMMARLVIEPSLALIRESETSENPTEIGMNGGTASGEPRPSGAPIALARIALATLELSAAWGIDLDAAMQVAHEDTLAHLPK